MESGYGSKLLVSVAFFTSGTNGATFVRASSSGKLNELNHLCFLRSSAPFFRQPALCQVGDEQFLIRFCASVEEFMVTVRRCVVCLG